MEEEVYSDWYLKSGNVYIEYWGMQGNPDYDEREAVKRQIYADGGFNLIELDADSINNLDDILQRAMLKYDISID